MRSGVAFEVLKTVTLDFRVTVVTVDGVWVGN
jgi:hypothetical protein